VLDVDDAPAAAPGRPANVAARRPTRPGPGPSCSPPPPGTSGRGTSPSSTARNGGSYYDLYVILDIFSRYVVGWTVAARESARIAEQLIADAVTIHGRPGSLHADRGTSMTSKPVAQLLVDLGVARSHSRPHVSNDNPYSEAAFKTLKYAPVFPDRFGCLADARAFCQAFFGYYNHQHRHSGIGWHTPASVHHGHANQVRQARAATLRAAYQANPSRVGHRPQPPRLPESAWINQPSREALIQSS
jgi:putative transposase